MDERVQDLLAEIDTYENVVDDIKLIYEKLESITYNKEQRLLLTKLDHVLSNAKQLRRN